MLTLIAIRRAIKDKLPLEFLGKLVAKERHKLAKLVIERAHRLIGFILPSFNFGIAHAVRTVNDTAHIATNSGSRACLRHIHIRVLVLELEELIVSSRHSHSFNSRS